MNLLLLVHFVCTVLLCGLIWTIQIVHYPLLRNVGPTAFPEYHREHCRRMGFLAAPLMLLELGTGTACLLLFPSALFTASYFLILMVWLSTFAIQVPCHRKLESGPDPQALNVLTLSNWFRTLAWSARVILLSALLK